MRPGSSVVPARSIVVASGGTVNCARGPTASIRSPRTSTAQPSCGRFSMPSQTRDGTSSVTCGGMVGVVCGRCAASGDAGATTRSARRKRVRMVKSLGGETELRPAGREGGSRALRLEDIEHRNAERGEVSRNARTHDVTVDDGRPVDPRCPGVDHVIANTDGGCDRPPAHDASGYENPRSMADRRHELAGGMHLAYARENFQITT